jgi:hypothetical protein
LLATIVAIVFFGSGTDGARTSGEGRAKYADLGGEMTEGSVAFGCGTG